MDEKPKVNDVVDTTDCLEAIAAFKATKNLFFVITFIALLTLQGIFWLKYLGYIDASEVKAPVAAIEIKEPITPETKKEAEEVTNALVGASKEAETKEATIKEHADKVVSDLSGGEKNAETPSVEKEAAEIESVKEKPENGLAKYMPNHEHAEVAIKVCNFVLVLSATIYCLLLLMSIKISLIGRLGGINHISRAFLLSLFALIILLPWQCLFEGVVLGAVYLPAELFAKNIDAETTLVCKALYFARFSGMWAISLLLLFAAQIRSAKWSKTTLRRLGILR